ncbi:MAG: hypothetical protein ABMB14_35850 [Myxococcota bacterium]
MFPSLPRSLVLVSLLVPAPGCFVTTMARTKAMSRAPSVALGLTRPVTVVSPDQTRYTLVSLRQEEACVQVEASVDPDHLLGARFELRSVRTPRDKLRDARASANPTQRLLDSSAVPVPYQTVVHDTVKDEQGDVIATTDRTVQAWGVAYQSSMEVCFPDPPLDGAEAYLMVRSAKPAVLFALDPSSLPWAPSPGWFKVEGAAMDR